VFVDRVKQHLERQWISAAAADDDDDDDAITTASSSSSRELWWNCYNADSGRWCMIFHRLWCMLHRGWLPVSLCLYQLTAVIITEQFVNSSVSVTLTNDMTCVLNTNITGADVNITQHRLTWRAMAYHALFSVLCIKTLRLYRSFPLYSVFRCFSDCRLIR